MESNLFTKRINMDDNLTKILDNFIDSWYSKNEKKLYIDQKMGLHGYFILHADHFLKKYQGPHLQKLRGTLQIPAMKDSSLQQKFPLKSMCIQLKQHPRLQK